MKKSKKLHRLMLFLIILFFTILVDFPILFVIINSFKSTSEIMMSGNSILPKNFTFDNYFSMYKNSNMLIFIRNSFFVTSIGTSLSIVVAGMAGFIMSRYKFIMVKGYSNFLLMMQMFPLILSLIPLFILFKKAGIVNTHMGVIAIYLSMNLPFATWMFKGFFDSIPKELEQAAWIDGYSKAQSFVRIVLPISGPGIIAVAIYSFLQCWNEYMIANIFLRKNELMTIPVGLQMFIQQYTSDWGGMFAAATTAMVPAFIIFVFFQKYIVSGVAAGSVKG